MIGRNHTKLTPGIGKAFRRSFQELATAAPALLGFPRLPEDRKGFAHSGQFGGVALLVEVLVQNLQRVTILFAKRSVLLAPSPAVRPGSAQAISCAPGSIVHVLLRRPNQDSVLGRGIRIAGAEPSQWNEIECPFLIARRWHRS